MRRISAVELKKWQAFYLLEPFGQEWRQTGTISMMVGNAFGGKRDGGKFKVDDFPPVPKREQTAMEMEATLTAALGMPHGQEN